MTPVESDSTSVQTVLSAVADPDCRTILGATDGRMTANEVATATDIPRSTVYRKLDQLQEADLLETSRRFETEGKHPTEYVRSFDRIGINIDGEDFTVIVGDDTQSPAPMGLASSVLPKDDQTAQLGDIFVSMTGRTTLVEPQRGDTMRNDGEDDDQESRALEEYVATTMTDDGLSEAIDGADTTYTID